MEDSKPTEFIEKRLSRGVIRRRAHGSAPAPAEAAPQQTQVTPSVAEAVVTVAPASVEPPQEAVIAAPETVAPAEEVSDVPPVQATTTTAKSKLVLSDEQKQIAQERLAKNLKIARELAAPAPAPAVQQPAPTQTPAPDSPQLAANERLVTIKEQPKKEERQRILSFKDRIKGTIDLAQFKPAKEQSAGKKATDSTAPAGDAPILTEEEEAAAAAKKEKASRTKKSVKTIGGDLDIEGLGRVDNLHQLVRTRNDRVFQPLTAGLRKKKIVSKKSIRQTVITEKKASKRVINIDQTITVGQLAQELGLKASAVIRQLMDLGVTATINQSIDRDTAALVAGEHQYEIKNVSFNEAQLLEKTDASAAASTETKLDTRPPIVTIMGHVDHGKTSLLDAIRQTSVTSTEAGGITQHIGAYSVKVNDHSITFLDTPGHEAFTTMRSRGAKVTDIVVLVVAADDGMMPQTEESIDHAKAAGVPIIVAINKIDKEQTDVERIKRQLSEKGLVPEEWGGDTIFNPVSALKKMGLKELLESILLQAEVLELNANKDARAKGTVLEAKLDKGRGPLCTLLVQSGTLRVGEYIVAGYYAGKVKAMKDWTGTDIKTAPPSTAVEVLGLEGVPDPSDSFNVVESEQDARSVVDHRIVERKKRDAQVKASVSLEDMFSRMKATDVKEFNILLKTDVQGSLEAIRDAVMKLGNEEIKPKIIHAGVGGINESDVRLATASTAAIIGFNVRPETKAIHIAQDNKIEIKLYKIIYDLVNEVKLAMQGQLAPEIKESYLGRAEVRQAFTVSKIGTIAGCMVVDGTILRSASLRLLRNNIVLHEGKITSLKRFKDDAREVKQGFECGIGIEGYQDIKPGDVIEAFEIKEYKKTLA